MTAIPHEIRYAARSLLRSPLFTVVAVVSLALAIAVNTTMFALSDGVLHPPVAYRNPDRLFSASMRGGDRTISIDERYRAMRDAVGDAADTTSYVFSYTTASIGMHVQYVAVEAVPANFFDVLGVQPEAGRVLGQGDQIGQSTVAVISHSLWVRLLAQRPLTPAVRINVGDGIFTVVGVAPPGMDVADVWVPWPSAPVLGATHGGPFPIFRLGPRTSRDILEAKLRLSAAELSAHTRRPLSVLVAPLVTPREMQLGYYGRLIVRILVTVLLIACANLATMMLSRGLARQREIAMRIAIGASRAAIVRLVLVECVLIVGAGALLGAVATRWGVQIAVHYASPYVPGLGDVAPAPSWRVFAFVLGLAALTLLLAGALPAFRAAAADPAEPIKDGAASTTGRTRDRYSSLIVLEVAAATALLMTAGLLALSAIRLASFDFQYDARRLMVVTVNAGARGASAGMDVGRFFDAAADRAARLPGATSAATWRGESTPGGTVIADERGRDAGFMNLRQFSVVSPTYLRTLGVPVVQGRDFAAGDRGSTTGVAIVDENAARTLWPQLATPVGRMLKFGREDVPGPWLRVVGVARQTEFRPRRDADLPPEPSIWVVYGRDTASFRDIIVRGSDATAQGQAVLAIRLHRELRSIAPWAPTAVEPWLAGYETSLQTNELMTMLFGAFALFALALCAVGFYGVLAYAVSRRLREMAVRLALGMRPRDLVSLVVHDAAVTILAGVGVGAFIALYVTRAMTDTLYMIPYADAIALVAAEALLFGVAIAASYGPVRRALRADPVAILRAS